MSQLEGIYLTKGGATRKVNKITKNLPSSTSQATVEVAKLGNIWINLVRSSFVCFLTPDHMTGESQDGVCATETRCRRQCVSVRAVEHETETPGWPVAGPQLANREASFGGWANQSPRWCGTQPSLVQPTPPVLLLTLFVVTGSRGERHGGRGAVRRCREWLSNMTPADHEENEEE